MFILFMTISLHIAILAAPIVSVLQAPPRVPA